MDDSITKIAIDKLLQMPKFGDGTGLHRVKYLLDRLEYHFQDSLPPAIKITGSNGKGSTSIMVASILNELGISQGLFTSPHILTFHERIKYNLENISSPDLLDSLEWFETAQGSFNNDFPEDRLGVFEAISAIAFYHFYKKKPDAIVLEAGIGGRFDPTRVPTGNIVGLTSLDLEHTQLMGNSLELIAYDKADLCPCGGTLIVGDIPSDIAERLSIYCLLNKINLIFSKEKARISEVSYEKFRMKFLLTLPNRSELNIDTNLFGPHQTINASIAVLLVENWLVNQNISVSNIKFKKAIENALFQVVWPVRLQLVNTTPPILIDAAHTPNAIAVSTAAMRKSTQSPDIGVVFGVSSDKDPFTMLANIKFEPAFLIITQATHRGRPIQEVATAAAQIFPDTSITLTNNVQSALSTAIATSKGSPILVTGGLFLAAEALAVMKHQNPKSLTYLQK